jgi:hypothetical protein
MIERPSKPRLQRRVSRRARIESQPVSKLYKIAEPAELGRVEGEATKKRSLPPSFVLLTPKEAAARLRVSVSFLAKARGRGDGPPFIAIGRSVRYSESALFKWMHLQQRLSTRE